MSAALPQTPRLSLCPAEHPAASTDIGCLSSSTFASSRLKTDFKDIASQVSAMPPNFLADIGAISNNDAFSYSVNTETAAEVGGVSPSRSSPLKIQFSSNNTVWTSGNGSGWNIEHTHQHSSWPCALALSPNENIPFQSLLNTSEGV